MDPLELRLKNMVPDPDHPLREIISELQESSDYQARKVEVANYNEENMWKKKGISIVPIKYRHNYWNTRYNVTISVFHVDGSVAVTHGGIEMGQGLNTKVCQVVAAELQVPMELISVKSTNSFTNPNASVTGGSMGSECNCSAAMIACGKLKAKMGEVGSVSDTLPWTELVAKCYRAGVDLSARHMGHSGRDELVGYDIWGAVCTQVQIDVLTGELNIERCDLVEDTGMAISPEVDVGQVEGGLIMGLGLWTTEQIRYDPESGQLVDNSSWEYKVPSCLDIPEDMRVRFYNSGTNKAGVLGSKATGEPSVLAGVSVLTALRQAIAAARQDAALPSWFQLDGPATVEKIKLACGVDSQQFKLY